MRVQIASEYIEVSLKSLIKI